jgi:hypothetical protein
MVSTQTTVERFFSVYQTGGNPYHHTVELPRPVTPQDAVRFTIYSPRQVDVGMRARMFLSTTQRGRSAFDQAFLDRKLRWPDRWAYDARLLKDLLLSASRWDSTQEVRVFRSRAVATGGDDRRT